MPLHARAVVHSDIGVVRARNEDSAYVDPTARFAIVADGMGGHGAGDIASTMAVACVRTHLEADEPLLAAYTASPTPDARKLVLAQLRRAVENANHEVFARSVREPDKHQMGSTIDVAVVCGREAFIAHVGDSRTYLVRAGAISQLTSDHTVAEAMRRAGTLAPEDVEASPMRSVLSNAIGVTPTVAVELARLTLRAGDRLLLCSDGLHDYFTSAELAAAMTGAEPEDTLAALVGGARARGGHDNITGVVIEVRSRVASTAPILAAEAVDDLADEATTSPVSMPLPPGVPRPLSSISDESIANHVDGRLSESSRPE